MNDFVFGIILTLLAVSPVISILSYIVYSLHRQEKAYTKVLRISEESKSLEDTLAEAQHTISEAESAIKEKTQGRK